MAESIANFSWLQENLYDMKVKPLSQFSTFLLILAEKVFYKSTYSNTKKN